MYKEKLTDYLPYVMAMIEDQLKMDELRWGDTWKKRPIGDYEGRGDQIDRAFDRISDYYDQYKNAGVPFPITKALGEFYICLVREFELRTSGELDSGEKNVSKEVANAKNE